jgi:hypothetical protein
LKISFTSVLLVHCFWQPSDPPTDRKTAHCFSSPTAPAQGHWPLKAWQETLVFGLRNAPFGLFFHTPA